MFNKTSSTLKRIIPLLFLFIIFDSCTSEFKPVTFKATSIDTDYDADISVTYDKAIDDNELGKIINFNVENHIIETLSDPTKKTKLEAILKDFNSEYLDFIKDFPDVLEPAWKLYIETEKTYQSENVITIAINTYEFKGGAHGNDKIQFLNLDAQTGTTLDQNAIIKNKDEFKKLAEQNFIKSLDAKNEQIHMEDFFFGKPFQLPENIGYSEDGLVLLYNAYELASYDQGVTEFVIPFKDLDSFLKIK